MRAPTDGRAAARSGRSWRCAPPARSSLPAPSVRSPSARHPCGRAGREAAQRAQRAPRTRGAAERWPHALRLIARRRAPRLRRHVDPRPAGSDTSSSVRTRHVSSPGQRQRQRQHLQRQRARPGGREPQLPGQAEQHQRRPTARDAPASASCGDAPRRRQDSKVVHTGGIAAPDGAAVDGRPSTHCNRRTRQRLGRRSSDALWQSAAQLALGRHLPHAAAALSRRPPGPHRRQPDLHDAGRAWCR